ncbi:calcium-binding protein [Amaricoccus macauensis]|uniref:calcium-binding protein n=1 Tax=Amaricoccus macauensis TaxID=57001 RepID=UPI003C7DF88D
MTDFIGDDNDNNLRAPSNPAESDYFEGKGGDDILYGKGGDDYYKPGLGNDTVGGGDEFVGDNGIDTVDYSDIDEPIYVDLLAPKTILNPPNTPSAIDAVSEVLIGNGDVDYINFIENVVGTPQDDNIRGDDLENIIVGGAGDDTLAGAGGDDSISGGAGDDFLYPGLGDDVVDGGSGFDTVSYWGVDSTGIVVELQDSGNTTVDKGLDTDEIGNVEHITGSERADEITGNENGNRIEGYGGNDTLDGGTGPGGIVADPSSYYDTAVYRGDRENYDVWVEDGVVMVDDNRTPTQRQNDTLHHNADEGVDELTNFERYEFKGVSYTLAELLAANDDYADSVGDASNPYGALEPDTSASGEIEDDGDRDLFEIELSEGYQYIFRLHGTDDAGGTLDDPELRIYDDAGDLKKTGFLYISYIDHLSYSPEADGTFYVEASSDVDLGSGTYTLYAETGGTPGEDSLAGGAGNDTYEGHSSSDTISGGAGDDDLDGGGGDDEIHGEAGADMLDGGGGEDTVEGGEGDDYVYGGAGNDRAGGQEGNDTVYGGGGDDDIAGGDDSDEVYGGAGNDTTYGGNDRDHVFGGEGSDTVYGGQGDDMLYGGDDPAYMEEGEETAGDGGDIIYGNKGDDAIYGDAGNDTLHGNQGNDSVSGQGGNDEVYGDDGNDQIAGGVGKDRVSGGDGNDTVYGGNDNDKLWGGLNKDLLYGGAGDDKIWGNRGADVLFGNKGKDSLYGGGGNDELTGGKHADVFVFGKSHGTDTITDYEDGVDRIEITKGANKFGKLMISEKGSDVEISWASTKVIVEDMNKSDFGNGDFIFS